MSFASRIKEELVRQRVREPRLKNAQLSGLTFACGSLKLGRRRSLVYRTENEEVARHIASLSASLYKLEITVEKAEQQHRRTALYVVRLEGETLMELLLGTGVMEEKEGSLHLCGSLPQGLIKEEESARAFVRGCFLGCGTCTDPRGEYHLELVCPTESFGRDMTALLEHFGLQCGLTRRRNRFVVYLKGGDDITGFLALIGSNAAALDLENVRAEKETRNYVNRTTNCEYANLDKLVAASLKQQQAAEIILRCGHFDKLPSAVREAAELRLNYPDASLQELADMADIKKSGMNHRLQRLMEYAEDLEKGLR